MNRRPPQEVKEAKTPTRSSPRKRNTSQSSSVYDFKDEDTPVTSSGKKSNGKNTPNTPFRRVISENIEIEKDGLRDNSYKSHDTWGAKASRDLIVTKGKSFRHEKTKKKRGSYKGGSIATGVNSIKFDD